MKFCVANTNKHFLCFVKNTANGSALLFEATDKDKLGGLTFIVEDQNGQDVSQKFEMQKVDEFSSHLAIKDLDYEQQYSYQLLIKVSVSCSLNILKVFTFSSLKRLKKRHITGMKNPPPKSISKD